MAHMNLKGKKKKIKIKYILIIFIFYIFMSITFYYSFKNISNENNQEFIKYLLDNGSALNLPSDKFPNIMNKTIKYLLKIDFTDPVTLFKGSIIDYNADLDNDEILESLKEVSSYITDPYSKEITDPIVYIYNSHQLENYSNYNLDIYGITPNVLMASYLLKEKLNNEGLKTIVETANLTEFLEINNWNYGQSYRASRVFILDKQNNYPSIKYFIDIHRDSVNKDITTVNIKGNNYAKILFVIGLEHNNWQDNYNLANDINELFKKKYPGISRGILKKEGAGVDGIYNQDISKNSMLIELGGVDNNINEVMNTINAITDVLKEYINEKK